MPFWCPTLPFLLHFVKQSFNGGSSLGVWALYFISPTLFPDAQWRWIDAVAPLERFCGHWKSWGGTQKSKAMTDFQEFYYAVVVYCVVENYVNMSVKNPVK